MYNSLRSPRIAACQTSLSFTVSWSLLRFVSIELMMPSSHLILCYPLLFLPSVFPSIKVFSNVSALCIMWSKYWSFSKSLSNEYSGLISFRIGEVLNCELVDQIWGWALLQREDLNWFRSVRAYPWRWDSIRNSRNMAAVLAGGVSGYLGEKHINHLTYQWQTGGKNQ